MAGPASRSIGPTDSCQELHHMAPAKPPAKREDRPSQGSPGAASTKIPDGGFPLDAETEAELIKFNVYLAAQRDLEARERRVRKAEQAKQDAAARVRQLADDPKATKEQREEAEQAYKEAVAKLLAIREGTDIAGGEESATEEPATGEGDSATGESATDESATGAGESATDGPATDESAADAIEAPES
jgi:hypothetical protein